MRFIKQVVGQGHVTVPSDLRDAMAIESGDIVEFEVIGVIRRRTNATFTSERQVYGSPSTS